MSRNRGDMRGHGNKRTAESVGKFFRVCGFGMFRGFGGYVRHHPFDAFFEPLHSQRFRPFNPNMLTYQTFPKDSGCRLFQLSIRPLEPIPKYLDQCVPRFLVQTFRLQLPLNFRPNLWSAYHSRTDDGGTLFGKVTSQLPCGGTGVHPVLDQSASGDLGDFRAAEPAPVRSMNGTHISIMAHFPKPRTRGRSLPLSQDLHSPFTPFQNRTV
jgi:hypothetical protein